MEDLLGSESISVRQRFDSADGTRRYLLSLNDGETIESVLIPRQDRLTFCISSQVGCSLGCSFCLTAQLGLSRNLSVEEIIGQVKLLLSELPTTGTNNERFSIVFMGMGEPFHNYDNVLTAVHMFNDGRALTLPMGRITVSTAGVVPGIERLAREPLFPNLSISLTGVTDRTRDVLMPINRKYSIAEVIRVVRSLPPSRQKRVMFEVVMIKGVTDSAADAEEMAEYLAGVRAKVNLIPLNPAQEIPYERSDDHAVFRFQEVLIRSGIATFIRKTRGRDISGACGQLKARQWTNAGWY